MKFIITATDYTKEIKAKFSELNVKKEVLTYKVKYSKTIISKWSWNPYRNLDIKNMSIEDVANLVKENKGNKSISEEIEIINDDSFTLNKGVERDVIEVENLSELVKLSVLFGKEIIIKEPEDEFEFASIEVYNNYRE